MGYIEESYRTCLPPTTMNPEQYRLLPLAGLWLRPDVQ